VQRIRDVDALRERQFPEDAGPNAHPVRPESCLAVDNFFTMTIYEKGAELIRMMQTTVGRKGFRRGMDLYFERHDGQAVSTDDFAAAIAEANQADFSQLKRWYSQAGTPVVRVQEQYDQASQEYRVTLSQSCPSTPGQPEKAPFQIPIRLGFLDSSGRELPCVAPEVRVNSDGAPLLELREAERQFVFTGLREKPVLSLFREFSAPVIVDWKRDDEELLFLMSHDPDGFNRREAGQTMALRVLERLVQALKCGETPEVNWGFVKAYGQALLDERISAAEKAGLLTLPSVALFAQTQPQVDALLWRRARRTLVGALGHAHQSALWEVYRRWHGVDSTSMATEVAATRELKNQALALLASTQTSQALEVLADQYASAKTMTDRMAALALLVESDHPERERLIEAFHEQWKSDSLVLNKWFRVQASADRDGVLKRVQALMGHPSFQVQNPNHVYSLLGAFGGNILHFHDPEHCAYPFFLGWVGAIDAKNPQVAARLCSSLGLIQKLEPSLQKQAQQEIQKVLELSTLSRNTRERLEPMMKLVSRG
jgi:aminopeptidase N